MKKSLIPVLISVLFLTCGCAKEEPVVPVDKDPTPVVEETVDQQAYKSHPFFMENMKDGKFCSSDNEVTIEVMANNCKSGVKQEHGNWCKCYELIDETVAEMKPVTAVFPTGEVTYAYDIIHTDVDAKQADHKTMNAEDFKTFYNALGYQCNYPTEYEITNTAENHDVIMARFVWTNEDGEYYFAICEANGLVYGCLQRTKDANGDNVEEIYANVVFTCTDLASAILDL